MAINVIDFGADPTGQVPSAAAINSALGVAKAAGGGKVIIPAGNYRCEDTIILEGQGGAISTYIEGEGPNATILDFASAPPDTDGVVIRATLAAGGGGLLWGVRDLAIVNAKRAGLTVNPENTVHAGPFCGMFEIINLYFFNCVGAGLEIADAYMGRISDIWSRQNGMGFYFRGGFTSLTVERCFAKENTNQGFSIDGAVYSVFSGCGSDENKWGYVLQNLNHSRILRFLA